MANHNYRIQQQHIAMARKRQRRRAAAAKADEHANPNGGVGYADKRHGNGVTVNIRQINAGDEGVLYTHRITERKGSIRKSKWRSSNPFSRRSDASVGSVRSLGSFGLTYRRQNTPSRMGGGIIGTTLPATPMSPPPQSETLRGFRTFFGKHRKQYTIASKKKYKNKCLNYLDKHHMNFMDYFCHSSEVDNNVYRPSTSLYRYIDWTFTASFTSVFMTFLFIYCALCLVFGVLLQVAGEHEPNCIVASGEPFGATPHTKFSDAFALSWTTFTTVGYGMTYTSTGGDLGDTDPSSCTWVVFLSLSEAFLGLLFAGMCAAILFGKVNRVQSHANLIFCNAVCLQYEEMEDDYHEENYLDSERSTGLPPERVLRGPMSPGLLSPLSPMTPIPSTTLPIPPLEDEENGLLRVNTTLSIAPAQSQEENKFVDQFNGCPILKFQVVNELCNREGGELVDCIMKVIGIKFKGPDGRVTHSQYVRVNLVDFEHPFLSRVWHGVHILDSTSPLLTDRARQRIKENNGSWPSTWFDPDVIRSKMEFHDLIVTVAGISNVSAVTVHAYKRYMIGDVLIGYNFAPIVFRDTDTGKLEVDLSMSNDVREQSGIRGEDLSIRRSGSGDLGPIGPGNLLRASTIRIKKSKSGDGLGSVTSHESANVKGNKMRSTVFSPLSSPGGSVNGNGIREEKVTSSDDIADPLAIPAIMSGESEETNPIANPPTPRNDVDPAAISPLEMEDPNEPLTSEDEIEPSPRKQVVFRRRNSDINSAKEE